MKKFLLGALGAAALLATTGTASADSWAANLSGSYANFSNGGGDVWNVDGAAQYTFTGNWGVEATAGWHNTLGADLGNIGGSLYWAGHDFRVAATVNYMDLSLLHLTSYGAGGEWFASPNLTVGLRGGGATGQFGIDGAYVGGDVKWYITPDLSLNGGVDYINLNGFTDLTSEDIRAEYLLSENFPLSVYGGYGHADSGGAGSQDIFFIGLKIYTNGDGATTLVDRQRSGNLGFIGGVPYFGQEL